MVPPRRGGEVAFTSKSFVPGFLLVRLVSSNLRQPGKTSSNFEQNVMPVEPVVTLTETSWF